MNFITIILDIIQSLLSYSINICPASLKNLKYMYQDYHQMLKKMILDLTLRDMVKLKIFLLSLVVLLLLHLSHMKKCFKLKMLLIK